MQSEKILVSDLMNQKVQTDFEDQNIMSACNIMYANNIGSVIIVPRNGTHDPVGIITERDVVRLRYGMNGGPNPKSIEDVVRELGMSREQVRRVEAKALARLGRMREIESLREAA